MRRIEIKTIQRAARVLRTIGHPDRLRIVEALEASRKSVKELMRDLRLSQVGVSKHLAVLKKEGIVRSDASANFRHYSILNRNVVHVLDCLRSQGGRKK